MRRRQHDSKAGWGFGVKVLSVLSKWGGGGKEKAFLLQTGMAYASRFCPALTARRSDQAVAEYLGRPREGKGTGVRCDGLWSTQRGGGQMRMHEG